MALWIGYRDLKLSYNAYFEEIAIKLEIYWFKELWTHFSVVLHLKSVTTGSPRNSLFTVVWAVSEHKRRMLVFFSARKLIPIWTYDVERRIEIYRIRFKIKQKVFFLFAARSLSIRDATLCLGGSFEITLTIPLKREYFRKCEEDLLGKELDQLKILNQQLKKRLEEISNHVKSLTNLYIRAIQRGDVVWKSSLPDYVTGQ